MELASSLHVQVGDSTFAPKASEDPPKASYVGSMCFEPRSTYQSSPRINPINTLAEIQVNPYNAQWRGRDWPGMRIAVTRRIHEDQVERLRDVAELRYWEHELPPSPEELIELVEGVDGALTLLTDRFDGTVFDQVPALRVISNLAVGYDNINVPEATSRGIAVCTTPSVLTDTTAEFAIALMFAVARRIVPAARYVAEGQWTTWLPLGFLGKDLQGATLGIVGLGRIGRRTGELGAALGMKVVYHQPLTVQSNFEHLPLEELLRKADIVSLHTPLTSETHGLMNAERIGMMKDDAILINTARGPVIDTESLVAALETGKLFGVGLDVTDPEPLPADHRLLSFDRVTVVPHIASASEATRHKMSQLAVDNVLAVLQGGDPPNCLNPEVLHRES